MEMCGGCGGRVAGRESEPEGGCGGGIKEMKDERRLGYEPLWTVQEATREGTKFPRWDTWHLVAVNQVALLGT
jgi:hypothetical protein